MSNRTFLQDRRFLYELDNLKIKTQYVKITVLNWKEEPLQEVQGKVISGSVNLDGNSSMRRTANLSILAQDKNNNLANVDNLFSINKKCKIELGIINTVPEYNFIQMGSNKIPTPRTINYQKEYGDIVWFPLGLYIMFNPSVSHATEGVTISMQLKDKMCLLNGDLGGQIHSGVDFTYQEEVTDGSLYNIETQPTLVYNIIKQLVNHWGNEKLSKIIISEVPLRIKRVVRWTGENPIYFYFTSNDGNIVYNLSTSLPEGAEGIQSFQQYDDIGYTYQYFTFPGQLSCNSGETVTSVLDKIINVLGNYEYFYDVDGNFIFREKQNYLNMSNTAYWEKESGGNPSNLPSDVYVADTYRLTKSIYNLDNQNFSININNSLNFNNIKNDFVVWGTLKNINSNITSLCRFHLAIDRKPVVNKYEHDNIILYKDEADVVRGIRVENSSKYDQKINIGGLDYTIVSKPQHRKSLDWREEIYYQMLESEFLGTQENTEENNSYFQYYAEIKEQFPKLYELSGNQYAQGWKQYVINSPERIYYFLDFIDEDSELGQFSVSNIGRRPQIKGENNDGINCVFEPAIPDIVYIDTSKGTSDQIQEMEQQLTEMGQRWIQIPQQMYDQFDIGGSLNSCFEQIKDFLYQYTHVNNSITISTIPLYHLEPGSRISVLDSQSGVDDDFIIQSISLPLDVSSTMSINAYKALQKI